ncbi:MAG: RES domain-containing protein [Planctomycetes bacterium]|nr:RES domain-containing protein [Planctomycetota bacterium]
MPEFKSWRDFWKFEQATKNQARYVRAPEVEAILETILQTAEKRVDVLTKGQILWRAQLGCEWEPIYEEGEHIDDRPTPHSPKRMKPLSGRANEGRANPKGIPYLYLATNRDTALAEVRPWIGSSISVGQFKTLRELRLVKCTTDKKGFLFYTKEPSAKEREESVWVHIDQAFARPVSPSDDIADYVPTQIIVELFKANNYDGVAYRSSLGDGYNIVLFDIEMAKLTTCFLFQVKSIDFEFKESANPYFFTPTCPTP